MSTTTESEPEVTDGYDDDDPRELLYNSSHLHGLVFQELTENFAPVECSVCKSSVKGGPAYYCPDPDCRDFFLHKYCAELPYEIQQHPYHPQHQLELRTLDCEKDNVPCSGCSCLTYLNQYSYQCLQCRIALHIGCAAATLPTTPSSRKERDGEHVDKSNEEETFRHIGHEHTLESLCVNNSPCPPYCSACKEKISSRAYGCRAYIFLLHESCALSPQEINNHPLHPNHSLSLVVDLERKVCRVCWNNSTRFTYRCNECDFYLDMRCAAYVECHYISIPKDDNNSQNSKDRQEIQHSFHPHPMAYCYTKGDTSLACKFCEEKIIGDFYVCGDCSFKLHKSCAESPQNMVHPLHPHHQLSFQTDYSECALCCYGRKILFKCQECDFGIHSVCALRSLSASEEEISINIYHIYEHPLRLWLRNVSCNICNEAADDLVYTCLKSPNFNRHRSCAEVARASQHSIHPPHPLILLSLLFLNSQTHCITLSSMHKAEML